MSNSGNDFAVDVLIIGAGLVGASLACALSTLVSQHGLRLALVERHDLQQPGDTPPSFDARASALSWGTRCIYDRLGLWTELHDRAQAISSVHVSDRGHFGIARLHAAEQDVPALGEQDVPALGYVVNNHHLGDVLLKRLLELYTRGAVNLLSPQAVKRLRPIPGGMKVQLNSGEVSASLVVVADGGRSDLPEQLGIGVKQTDYQQHAVIANIALDRPHGGTAWERFAGQGPVALLPLVGDDAFAHRSALVWTVPNQEIERVNRLTDDEFLAVVQERFGNRAGRFLAVGKRDSYPLSMRLAREQVRPGLVILGNAAHAIHPVAGQGYNLSMRDTMALAENISASFIGQQPVGDLGRLMAYQRQQHRDQSLVSAGCNGLVNLFARTDGVSVLARNLGLVAFDYCRPLKSAFTRKAMGEGFYADI